jgi:putative SOS response-associated peptidase YedK
MCGRYAVTSAPEAIRALFGYREQANFPPRYNVARAKSGQPLAFAALSETWTGPNGEGLETAAIVTTRSNRALADVHERMPVIVPPEAFNLWPKRYRSLTPRGRAPDASKKDDGQGAVLSAAGQGTFSLRMHLMRQNGGCCLCC